MAKKFLNHVRHRQMSTFKRIRVLHVVGRMDRGGVETWLMHLLRNMDREKYGLDFLVHTSGRAAYDEELGRLGSKVIPCLGFDKPWLYAKHLRQILAEIGPYDVVHSHVHHYSGWVLRTAHQAGVPIRLAHGHGEASFIQTKETWARKIYYRVMRSLLKKHATLGLAVSTQAAKALWGVNWRRDKRWRVFYCGIDLKPFAKAVDQQAVRSELRIPADSIVLGHVGSFSPVKNHDFLMQIGAAALRENQRVVLLLVGDGALRRQMEAKATMLGIRDRVIFAGTRPDIARILMGAMDVFVFPSLSEGLPLAVIEAQAAGVPVILSDAITREVEIVPELLSWLPLTQAAGKWAKVALAKENDTQGIAVRNAYQNIEHSRFDIQNGVAELTRIYEQGA
jgi:glycosyltransferase involved in cell wall biosynthesis